MHTLVTLSSLVLVLLAGYAALLWLRHVQGWGRRRDLQVLVLAAPLVSLALALGGLSHFAGRACFRGAPAWDYVLGLVAPLAMGLVALGGLLLGLARLVLMRRVVARSGQPASAEVQGRADHLATRLGTPRPRVLCAVYDRPLALTCGLFRPTLLLSTWLVEHLDQHELESVLAHELGHVARRDYLVVWLTTLLRDAFFYLPTSWAAYGQLQQEKELACDDLAISATNRPLALASALAKVWHQVLDGPGFGLAQPLADATSGIEGRIERLLATLEPAPSASRARVVTLSSGVTVIALLVAAEAATLALMLAPMGCGPMVWITRLV